MIAFSHVGKTFPNGTTALNALSFTVAQGEFVSLLGPSGCGKSTALRLAAGLLTPDTGAVAYPGGKPDIGFVFQNPTLMPWADALGNVRLPLDLQKIPPAQAQARAEAALARVGLAGFAAAYPRELSGGMKMRVSIARALCSFTPSFMGAARPKLLLLDEPFAALDEFTRARLGDDLRRLWREEALSVIFVTHSIAESAYLSNRVLVMTPRPGRVSADIVLAPGRDDRLAPMTIDAQRMIRDALDNAGALA